MRLKGNEVSQKILEDTAQILRQLHRASKLCIVRFGSDAADLSYQNSIIKKCDSVGVNVQVAAFGADITSADFMRRFRELNASPEIDGILVLRPIPKQIDADKMQDALCAKKDIDCIGNLGLGSVFVGDGKSFAPCTAQAVMEILKHYQVDLCGKHAVILGRSLVVSKPLAMMLLEQNATITICHSKTKNLCRITREADILISAIGHPKFVDSRYVNKDMVVIDVGINTDENGKICGDIDFDSVEPIVSSITPVPGGVGAVTTAILIRNTVLAASKST
ncbi:MAG: bifunctional 5,10-methylenetetrahydrofolate dehydrogenase/5,10-methenyltetrahydrofolate cyclohydrolase [Oscillospiraceae bacterium]|jgi:methylenetetrahydrofolate dehydrogenase (NADP+)/methenyltetrahydrofolate cyclohydrolase|nr:bifunctional 5,10-methylenetetrahydrofolate dehydrogenase/5,10-methenyltetrahydrofolate cyclohydrolase [Oscillospiraceae bacterium]